MKPTDVNGKHLNGMPQPMFDAAMAKIKEREHYWIATVMFEMSDEKLSGPEIELAIDSIRTQSIRCMVCGMEWRRGRQGRICPGGG